MTNDPSQRAQDSELDLRKAVANAPRREIGDPPSLEDVAGLVYLASPYSDPDPAVMEARFDAVCREAAVWMGRGVHLYSPIAHTHPIAVRGDLPKDWTFWEKYDRVMLAACSEVWVLTLDGYEGSRGVAAEVNIATEMGLPVRYITPSDEAQSSDGNNERSRAREGESSSESAEERAARSPRDSDLEAAARQAVDAMEATGYAHRFGYAHPHSVALRRLAAATGLMRTPLGMGPAPEPAHPEPTASEEA